MGDLLIRNISDALRADIESLARKRGQSLSDTAREALRAGIVAVGNRDAVAKAAPAGERLRAIFAGAFESNEEADEFQRNLDQVRRGDFGRPIPDPE